LWESVFPQGKQTRSRKISIGIGKIGRGPAAQGGATKASVSGKSDYAAKYYNYVQ